VADRDDEENEGDEDAYRGRNQRLFDPPKAGGRGTRLGGGTPSKGRRRSVHGELEDDSSRQFGRGDSSGFRAGARSRQMGAPSPKPQPANLEKDPIIQKLQQIAMEAREEATEARKELQQLKTKVDTDKSTGPQFPMSGRPRSENSKQSKRLTDALLGNGELPLDRTLESESRFIYPDGTSFVPRSVSAGPGTLEADPGMEVSPLHIPGPGLGLGDGDGRVGSRQHPFEHSPIDSSSSHDHFSAVSSSSRGYKKGPQGYAVGRARGLGQQPNPDSFRSDSSTPASDNDFDVDALLHENRRKWRILQQMESGLKNPDYDDDGYDQIVSGFSRLSHKPQPGQSSSRESAASGSTGRSPGTPNRPYKAMNSPLPSKKPRAQYFQQPQSQPRGQLADSFLSIPLHGSLAYSESSESFLKPGNGPEPVGALPGGGTGSTRSRSALSLGGLAVVGQPRVLSNSILGMEDGTPNRSRSSINYPQNSHLSVTCEEDDIDFERYGF